MQKTNVPVFLDQILGKIEFFEVLIPCYRQSLIPHYDEQSLELIFSNKFYWLPADGIPLLVLTRSLAAIFFFLMFIVLCFQIDFWVVELRSAADARRNGCLRT